MRKITILTFGFLLCFISFSSPEDDERLKTILNELTQVSNEYIKISNEDENTLREQITKFAKENLDKPYSWGSVGPDKFDCSGFMTYLFNEKSKIKLPRVSKDMSEMNNEKKDISQLKIGDLLFFITSGGETINHVGLYIGNNEFIHASSAKNKVVISKIDSNFYSKAFKWALSPY